MGYRRGKAPPTYSARRPPTEADANVLGYVFARSTRGVSYSGVKWYEVKLPEYDRWCRTDDKPRAYSGKKDGTT